MNAETASTPLMRQYHAIKQQVPGALLMFRLGDFYELFLEDAVLAARELGITLTSRNKEKGAAIPMCGVPYHSAEGYIARLIGRGYRVAICDQVEEAAPGKKLVRREITRIVTPGTATDAHLLRSHENNYLAAVSRNGTRAGLAYVDVSTGEFRATELDLFELPGLLESIGAREVLVAAEAPLFPQPEPKPWIVTELDDWVFSPDYSDRILREHFHLHSLDGCGLSGKHAAIAAGGAVLHYLRDTQRAALDHLDPPRHFDRAETMVLDGVTVRNLELTDPIFYDRGADSGATLIGVLDQTATGMGGRMLRQRLLRPSLDRNEIESRLDAVTDLARETILRAELRKQLTQVLDVERLLAKVMIGSAGPRDLLALGKSLDQTPRLAESVRLAAKPLSTRLADTFGRLDSVPEASGPIIAALSDTPPVNLGDGATIRAGYDPELDELRDLSQNGRQYIAQIEARERQRTGIASLKVRFNNVFGYYIEISKANLHLAPADYERKQTLVNAERFTTPELKEYERKVLVAEEKILEIEKRIFAEIRQKTADHAQRIRATASAIAELDVSGALAQVAAENRYSRPRFSTDGEMRIAAGRHPVIEKLTSEEAARFIPNDLYLNDAADQVAIITGPNMGGKSTYLRQAALIAILAQMGSWVPAEDALLPIIDRIFTRIGASDNLARGRSTFMVEMTETAVILNTATPRSFIILDEIGRGTATYDGLSLAWAVVEHVSTITRAKTLFATHYHELTELAEQLEGVRNLRVAVKEAGDRIIFLRRVEPGKADRSYGIEVARLAGLPMTVIERAREVLTLHEKTEHRAVEQLSPGAAPAAVQIHLFEPGADEIKQKIRALKIDDMRPVEALRFLEDLQRQIE
jgi:DNA mismatch repair protein MutS